MDLVVNRYRSLIGGREKYQYVGYAQYDQRDLVVNCMSMNYVDYYDEKICIIGHSWGGDVAMQACRDLETDGKKVAVLATPDAVDQPASHLFGNRSKPTNVANWINVYVNYSKASTGVANTIARIGGPWGACPGASANYEYPYIGGDAHAMAWQMLVSYVLPALLGVR